MPPADPELSAALDRADLPPSLERWWTVLAPGTSRATTPTEWAGSVLLVESGALEVLCAAGGHRSFAAGDLLALDWLPVVRLRNPGPDPVRLLAVRRRARMQDR